MREDLARKTAKWFAELPHVTDERAEFLRVLKIIRDKQIDPEMERKLEEKWQTE